VSSQTALVNAINAASTPVTILLAPGTYDLVTINSKSGITLRSALDSSPATLRALYIKNSANIVVDNMVIAGANTNLAARLWVYQSAGVALSRINIPGVAGTFDSPLYCGFSFRSSSNVSLRQFRVSWARNGICLYAVSSISIEQGVVRDIQSDGINAGAVQGLLVRSNDFSRSHPTSTDHPDAVQIFATDTVDGSSNIVVDDNLFSRDGGGISQGIFLRDSSMTRPFKNVTITNNVILGGMYNGIALLNGITAKISNNLIVGYPDMISWIRVSYAQDVTVESSQANRFLLDPGVGSGGNAIVPQSQSTADQIAAQWRSAHGY
jgi:hypothetical protein